MTYRVNRVVDHAEYERHHPVLRQYLKTQRERGLMFDIDNVSVDVEQLGLRTFQCNSGYCLKCSGAGAARTFKGSCCTDLQVDLVGAELDKIEELARAAKEKLTFKPGDPVGRIVDHALAGKVTEVTEGHELIFRHRKDGSCAMSWIGPDGRYNCGINTLAWRLGMPLEIYKPSPCYLFPLHYAEWDPGRLLVSLLTEETRHWAGHHAKVGKLRCLSRPEPGAPPAYVSLKGEIELCFGNNFYAELEKRMGPFLKEYRANEAGADSGAGAGAKAKAASSS